MERLKSLSVLYNGEKAILVDYIAVANLRIGIYIKYKQHNVSDIAIT